MSRDQASERARTWYADRQFDPERHEDDVRKAWAVLHDGAEPNESADPSGLYMEIIGIVRP